MATTTTATFTAIGVSAVTSPTVNGNTTITLTNTSSFIGTVFLETSLDGGETFITPATALTGGTMVAGPLTFNFTVPQLASNYQIAQHRLHCTAYTSGTLTYTMTEATAAAITPGVSVGPQGSTSNLVGNFTSILGTTTNDSAAAGMIGEYDSNSMTTVGATGTTFTCAIASPGVFLATAHGLSDLQAVYVSTTGTLPTGFSATTIYYTTLGFTTANSFQLSSTLANAVAGTSINATGASVATCTVHQGCYLASTTAADICGLYLQPGDYDVDALVFPGYGSSTSVTSVALWIAQVGGSAVPTTAALVLAQGLSGTQVATANTANTTQCWTSAGTLRVSLSAAGYLALATVCTFTVSTLIPQALLRARRVR